MFLAEEYTRKVALQKQVNLINEQMKRPYVPICFHIMVVVK